MANHGIDYGRGRTNIDLTNGIRFGVIHANDVAWWDENAEADYGEPCCPKCGNDVVEYDHDTHDGPRCPECSGLLEPCTGPEGEEMGSHWCGDCELGVPEGEEIVYTESRGCCDYACEHCHHTYDSSDCYGESPHAWTLDDGEYTATQGGEDCDIFVLSSPYYTHAKFCSPCTPGACYLRNPVDEDGPRCYCFGHDWFEEGVAPYKVYRVSDGSVVVSEKVEPQTPTESEIEDMVRQYRETALWSSLDDDGTPLDKNFDVLDIDPDTMSKMRSDCEVFAVVVSNVWHECGEVDYIDWGQVGHDFWLTRNGHGAGFWDGDWPTLVGKRLTEEAKRFGEYHLLEGSDGELFGE